MQLHVILGGNRVWKYFSGMQLCIFSALQRRIPPGVKMYQSELLSAGFLCYSGGLLRI
jgi:hypothetical protein